MAGASAIFTDPQLLTLPSFSNWSVDPVEPIPGKIAISFYFDPIGFYCWLQLGYKPIPSLSLCEKDLVKYKGKDMTHP
eukprot:15366673-Ditylum_brightwellii.AAC.1